MTQPRHEHEAWQIQDDGEGKRYCAACGQQVVRTVRKDRVNRVTDFIEETITGPTHITHEWNQTWCGRKMIGFGLTIDDLGSLDDVTCKTCLTAYAHNQPKSWRR